MANDLIELEPISITDDISELVNALNILIANQSYLDSGLTSIDTTIGLPLSRLATVEKTTLIDAINSFLAGGDVSAFTLIGDLAGLTTTDKANLVAAVNFVNARVDVNTSDIETLIVDTAAAVTRSNEAYAIAQAALVSAEGATEGDFGTQSYIIVPDPSGTSVLATDSTTTGQIQIIVPGFLIEKFFKFEVVIAGTTGEVIEMTIFCSISSSSNVLVTNYIQKTGTSIRPSVSFGKNGTSIVIGIGSLTTNWSMLAMNIKNVVAMSSTKSSLNKEQWSSTGWNVSIKTTAIPQITSTLSGRYFLTPEEVDSRISLAKTEAINTSYNNAIVLATALG